MTGFGRATVEFEGGAVTAEVKTVNNRFLKVTLRMPEALRELEADCEALVRQAVTRGSVNVTLAVSGQGGQAAFALDEEFCARLYQRAQELAERLHTGGPSLAEVMALPGVMREAVIAGPADEALFKAVRQALGDALEGLKAMRRHEGDMLAADMRARAQRVAELAGEVEARAPRVIAEYRDKLKARIEQLLQGTTVQLDEATLVRETAFFADKCDIAEETTRLRHHCAAFGAELKKDAAVGRKLDFIAQELLREANTVGSKANDAELAALVVEMKTEIERIKEQVQNLE